MDCSGPFGVALSPIAYGVMMVTACAPLRKLFFLQTKCGNYNWNCATTRVIKAQLDGFRGKEEGGRTIETGLREQ